VPQYQFAVLGSQFTVVEAAFLPRFCVLLGLGSLRSISRQRYKNVNQVKLTELKNAFADFPSWPYRINLKQGIVLILGVLFTVACFSELELKASAVFFVVLGIAIAYFSGYLFWMLAYPLNGAVHLNSEARNSLEHGRCPICRLNHLEDHRLQVGYSKPRFQFVEWTWYGFRYRFWVDELAVHLPICNGCCKRFLNAASKTFPSVLMRNPSKLVLRRKYGWLRGVQFPFLASNVQSKRA
jgi:hypothetical protein